MTPAEHTALIREELNTLRALRVVNGFVSVEEARDKWQRALESLVDRDARIQELERERDALQAKFKRHHGFLDQAEARLEAARQALQKITEHGVSSQNWVWCNKVARDALAGMDEPPEEVSEPDAAADKGAVTSAVAESVRTPSGSLTSPVAQENKT